MNYVSSLQLFIRLNAYKTNVRKKEYLFFQVFVHVTSELRALKTYIFPRCPEIFPQSFLQKGRKRKRGHFILAVFVFSHATVSPLAIIIHPSHMHYKNRRFASRHSFPLMQQQHNNDLPSHESKGYL